MAITNNKKWSFRLLTTEDRKRKDGSYPVAIVLSLNGRKLITQDNITGKPNEWNKETERFIIKRQNPEAVANNMALNILSSKIDGIINDYRERNVFLSNTMLAEMLDFKKQSITIEGYINNYIQKLYAIQKIGPATIFETMLSYFKEFDEKFNKRAFQEVNYDYVVAFVQSQLNVTRKNGPRKKGGISVHLRAMRKILNEAIKDGVGSPETYPFSTKYCPNQKVYLISKELKTKTRKRYIPDVLLRKFFNYKFTSKAHQRSQALFFFSFFAGGINFSDMAKLKKGEILTGFNTKGKQFKYFTFYRNKTNEPIEVVTNKDIQQQINILQNNFKTINDYLLPIVTTTSLDAKKLYKHIAEKRKKLNMYLKQMAKIMEFPEGLEDLSTYFARHSFAMKMLSKTDNIFIVSQSLHHKDIETTKIYLEDFKADEIAEVTGNLLD